MPSCPGALPKEQQPSSSPPATAPLLSPPPPLPPLSGVPPPAGGAGGGARLTYSTVFWLKTAAASRVSLDTPPGPPRKTVAGKPAQAAGHLGLEQA